MPQFPGDMSAFIEKNLRYPAALLEDGVEGKVLIRFIVRKDGSTDSIRVLRPCHPLFDAEAKRVIAIMPCWTPGKRSGKPVDVFFVLPITFKLD